MHQIFEELMKNLIIDKPEDPLTYLAEKVIEPECIKYIKVILFLLLDHLDLM